MAKDTTGQGKGPIIDLAAEEVGKPAKAGLDPAAPRAPVGEGKTEAAKNRPEEPARAAADAIPSALAGAADSGGPRSGSRPARNLSPASIALAAMLGAALAILAVFALARGGYLADDRTAGLAPTVAALRESLASVEQRAAGNAATIVSLQQEMQTLRQDFSALPAGIGADFADRLGAVEERLAALAGQPTAIAGDGVDLAPLEAAVADLDGKLAALSENVEALPDESRVVALEAGLQEAAADARNAAGLAPAVVADALAAAVESGAPFGGEIAALRRYGVDPAALDELQAAAETGLPTLAKLRADFELAIAAIDLRPPVAEGTGAIDRLIDSARGLVEVRPADPVAGSDPAAVVARIRAALAAGALGPALAEWELLPETAKAATTDWRDAAAARLAADRLVLRLRTDALSRLASED